MNVCSQAGKMDGYYSDEWKKYFQNQQLSEEDIDKFVEAYKQFVTVKNYLTHYKKNFRASKENNRKQKGFPESAYRVSKTAEIAYTLLQSKLLKTRNIIVNAVSDFHLKWEDVCCIAIEFWPQLFEIDYFSASYICIFLTKSIAMIIIVFEIPHSLFCLVLPGLCRHWYDQPQRSVNDCWRRGHSNVFGHWSKRTDRRICIFA